MEGPRLVKHPPCTIITHGFSPAYLQLHSSCCIIACSLLSHFASGYHTFVGVVALLLVSCSCCIRNRPVTLCGHYIHICTLCPAVCYYCCHFLPLCALASCYCYLLFPFAIAICYRYSLFAICYCYCHLLPNLLLLLLFAIACYSICYCYLHMLYAHSHLMLRFAAFRIRYHYICCIGCLTCSQLHTTGTCRCHGGRIQLGIAT